ncbi:MAG: HNH endonuclease [Planctomycetota bacterium]
MTLSAAYDFPSGVHVRKHGPQGYSDYSAMKHWLRDEFTFRCVFCLDRETFAADGYRRFACEHYLPKSTRPDLRNDYDNLLYACNRCNWKKSELEVVSPEKLDFRTLLKCNEDGCFAAIATEGQDLIDTLDLNHPERVDIRKTFITLFRLAESSECPEQLRAAALRLRKYPDELPNLVRARESGNSRPTGKLNCYHAQRAAGMLPAFY